MPDVPARDAYEAGVAAVGLSGYVLFRYVHQFGLAVMALYGALGLDGLGHYSLAPFSAPA